MFCKQKDGARGFVPSVRLQKQWTVLLTQIQIRDGVIVDSPIDSEGFRLR